MSKKIMLLALAVAALFALPSAASAQEAHISGITSFAGSGGASTLQASGEPTITCTKTSVTGSFNAGSTTTATYTMDLTGCTAEFFGIKANCNTSGAASGTIASHGISHVVTVPKGVAYLWTDDPTTIICAGFSNSKVSGNVIGRITSPACGASSKTFTVVFASSGSTQELLEYTGVKYDLTAQTGSGSLVTAGLNSTITLESSTSGTLECT